MYLNQRFRVMWTQTGEHFFIAEAPTAEAPWRVLRHNLTGMTDNTTVSPRRWVRDYAAHGASTFVDPASGRTYVYANEWIQGCDSDGLNWIGQRFRYANRSAIGVGLIENPSLMVRNGVYFMHASVNGTSNWGIGSAQNGGLHSSSYATLAVWRAESILGPWNGPRLVITSNVEFASVNTGTVVLGLDDNTWYYLYNATEARRWSLQRQLMLDCVDFSADHWPLPMTPSNKRPLPANIPAQTWKWRPDLSDEFTAGKGLEGITTGVLGSKWLFKEEQESLWSLTARPAPRLAAAA